MKKPYLIEFNKIGNPSEGYISIAEIEKSVPFELKRCFWTYFTPEDIIRGRHAHYETEMILVAVAGKITVDTEMPDGSKEQFILERPNVGVFLPKLCWHTMQYSHSSVQLVLASTVYNEKDYIRNYKDFELIEK
jgi:hypothetical protein